MTTARSCDSLKIKTLCCSTAFTAHASSKCTRTTFQVSKSQQRAAAYSLSSFWARKNTLRSGQHHQTSRIRRRSLSLRPARICKQPNRFWTHLSTKSQWRAVQSLHQHRWDLSTNPRQKSWPREVKKSCIITDLNKNWTLKKSKNRRKQPSSQWTQRWKGRQANW